MFPRTKTKKLGIKLFEEMNTPWDMISTCLPACMCECVCGGGGGGGGGGLPFLNAKHRKPFYSNTYVVADKSRSLKTFGVEKVALAFVPLMPRKYIFHARIIAIDISNVRKQFAMSDLVTRRGQVLYIKFYVDAFKGRYGHPRRLSV